MPSLRDSAADSSALASEPGSVTQVLDPEVWNRWRSGPRWYYALATVVVDPAVEQRRVAVAAALSEWLLPTGPKQAHVTVRTLGFEPVVWRPHRVDLRVGEADTFTAAAYLAVESPQILELRESWAAAAPTQLDWPPEDRTGPYLPHVTVGTYREVVSLATVRDRLAQLPPGRELHVTAEIKQIAIDTRSPVGDWQIV